MVILRAVEALEQLPPQMFTTAAQLLDEGASRGSVVFHQGADSAKDYISLDHVLRLLPMIAATGHHRLYNVAAGRNTTHEAIANALRR